VSTALTLGGCDFAAPIDPTPTRALDPALFGTWRCLGASAAENSEPANFEVSPAADEHLYSISFGEEGKTPIATRATSRRSSGKPP
jgi:hypothetical protein